MSTPLASLADAATEKAIPSTQRLFGSPARLSGRSCESSREWSCFSLSGPWERQR